jgi:hypothetical protein
MQYNDEIEASIKKAIESIFAAGGQGNYSGEWNYEKLREKYQRPLDKLGLEEISKGLDEIAAYVDDAQGEWNNTEIPYCPDWIAPYKELSVMIERLQDLLEDVDAKE